MKNIMTVLMLVSSLSVQVQAKASDQLSYEQLLSQYITWAQQIEEQSMQLGEPLDKSDFQLAKEIGIKAPEKVRLVYADSVPFPYENAALKAMGESLGFIGKGITNNAQAFGYAIYIRKDFKLTRPELAHELVHVLQSERGGYGPNAVQYLTELAQYGHKNAPLEVEAYQANKKYAVK